MIRTPRPGLKFFYKPVQHGVRVDIEDDVSEVAVADNFFSFEIGDEKATPARIHFIVGLSITAE